MINLYDRETIILKNIVKYRNKIEDMNNGLFSNVEDDIRYCNVMINKLELELLTTVGA